MNAAVLVAVAAALGNLLQGWDNATMAGAIMYIKREFKWENEPTMEGLTVAMSLIGAAFITPFSGRISDILGRKPMLVTSSILYVLSSLLMIWSPNVHSLLFARLLDGFGIGLTITFVPLYISEMSPPQIRGLLSTVPQFTYSTGSFLSYCMVFGMSLVKSPNWRAMLGVIVAPSVIYLALTVFYLPESPRWLVSKGRMLEARRVLQRLRGREDVSDEMALLVEGLGAGDETTMEEYLIHPANEVADTEEEHAGEEIRVLIGPDGHSSVVATSIPGQFALINGASRQGSTVKQSLFSIDPTVALFGSVHEKVTDTGSKGSMYFPHLGSMFSVSGNQPRNEEWDEESLARENEDYAESEDNLQSPLISRQATSLENLRQESPLHSARGTPGESTGIGSGWQLAWNVNKGGSFKRVYLHEDGASGSWKGSLLSIQGGMDSVDGEFIKAAALVSQPALCTKELMDQHPVGPAMVHPSVAAAKRSNWEALFLPGVKNALLVGMGIEMLQQFVGINGILNYTPQILEQAGVGIVMSDIGINSASASVLISAIMTMLMLPCIAIAMRLMDISGRRSLLLSTGPVLTASLIFLAIGNGLHLGTIAKAAVSTISIVCYGCSFVMGFGPIPNILCSEIFPTRVRSTCIAICALSFWISNVIVTYSFPMMLSYIGVSGIFSIYAVWSVIALGFVFLKVPETKGMPLEVITEFFAVGAKKIAA